MPRFAAIIPAAGKSSRFGRNKLMEVLDGQSVLWRSVNAFARRADVAGVFVAGAMIDATKVHCVPGGACRAESVRMAAMAVPADVEWVAVHDAARPLVTSELIDRVLTAALEHGAAAPALPVALTIKQARGPLPARAERTVDRAQLWAMQTPQVMRRHDLLEAFSRCPIPLDQITDDLQLLELAGRPVWLVPGDQRNIKITQPIDLRFAQWILESDTAGN